MIRAASTESSPDGVAGFRSRINLITEAWLAIDTSGDTGVAQWEVLVPLRDRVTDCLGKSPPDVDKAEQLTALAFMLMQGIADA